MAAVIQLLSSRISCFPKGESQFPHWPRHTLMPPAALPYPSTCTPRSSANKGTSSLKNRERVNGFIRAPCCCLFAVDVSSPNTCRHDASIRSQHVHHHGTRIGGRWRKAHSDVVVHQSSWIVILFRMRAIFLRQEQSICSLPWWLLLLLLLLLLLSFSLFHDGTDQFKNNVPGQP